MKNYFHLSGLTVFMPSMLCCQLPFYGFILPCSAVKHICLLYETYTGSNSLEHTVLVAVGE